MSPFFTADPHYGHRKICTGEWPDFKRPFDTVEQMNRTLIENHNSVVGPKDTCYMLGDIFLGLKREEMLDIRSKLNGNLFLIIGNHDKDAACKIPQAWGWMKDRYRLNLKVPFKIEILLDHYAGRTWSGSHKGSWHLYGHSHGQLPEDPRMLAFDCGVDCWDFKPISLEQVIDKMKCKLAVVSSRQGWKCSAGHAHRTWELAWECNELPCKACGRCLDCLRLERHESTKGD